MRLAPRGFPPIPSNWSCISELLEEEFHLHRVIARAISVDYSPLVRFELAFLGKPHDERLHDVLDASSKMLRESAEMFPDTLRIHAKIGREKLAHWASKQLKRLAGGNAQT